MRRHTLLAAAKAGLTAHVVSLGSTAAFAQDLAPDVSVATALLPRDLSPLGMFLSADIVVKTVMLGLAFASLVTWTVFLAKSVELIGAWRRLTAALAQLDNAASLGAVRDSPACANGIVALLLDAARAEIGASSNLPSRGGLKERIASRLERVEAAAGRQIVRGTTVLATIGATAPFVGLFGTVWGIMNSFIGISRSHTTNLAVVAPGIAEALLATAMGLVAAIPAVMIYNLFARWTTGYRAGIGDAAAAVLRIASLELDRAGREGEAV